MSEENSPDDEHDALIARYRQTLEPTPPAIDERALWFEAGRSAAAPRRGGWLLPAYSGVMTAVAASLAWAVVQQPVVEPAAPAAVTLVAAPVDPPATEVVGVAPPAQLTPWAKLFPAPLPPTNTYAARQRRMLREDFDDDLGPTPSAVFDFEPSPPATRERLLEEYLPDRDLPVPPKPSEGRQNTQQTRRGVKELA